MYVKTNLRLCVTGVLLLALSFVASAQDDTCSVDFSSTLDQVNTICSGTGRNQVCYGNLAINAIPQANVINFNFDGPGDISNVTQVKSLSLSAMSSADWGVALMKIQANLSPDALEDVHVVLLGDSTIEDVAVERTELPATVATTAFVNVRRRPSINIGASGVLAPQTNIVVNGRLNDSSWLRVLEPETNLVGWVAADLLDVDGDIDALLTEAFEAPYFGPMQAIYLDSSNQSTCGVVPLDGMFIQTPEGVGRVSMWVNELSIDFLSNDGGSTALVTQPDETEMVVQMLEGASILTGNDATVVAPAGSEVHIRLNADGTLDGTPAMPIPYDETGLDELARAAGYRLIDAASPASRRLIAQVNTFDLTPTVAPNPPSVGVPSSAGPQPSVQGTSANPSVPNPAPGNPPLVDNNPPSPNPQVGPPVINDPCANGQCDPPPLQPDGGGNDNDDDDDDGGSDDDDDDGDGDDDDD